MPPVSVLTSIAVPLTAFSNTTMPVGVPPEPLTEPLKLATDPAGTGKVVVVARVVVVAVRLGTLQLDSRLVTLIVPRPLAKSNPAVVLNAGVELPLKVAMNPNCPAVVLLQFGLLPWQATELLPLVMS